MGSNNKPFPLSNKRRDYNLLSEIGLSKTAVLCYQSLVNEGHAKVSELAERLGLPRTGLYRVLEKLYEQGFIYKTKLEGLSTTYKARPIHQAAEQYFKYQKRIISPLLGGYEEFAKKYNREL